MRTDSIRYLIVPGWQGSPDGHWQRHWHHTLPNSEWLEQADWNHPQKDHWVSSLDHAIASTSKPTVLIAHSLGCITVAHWASQAPLARVGRVQGALLVAPADVERPNRPSPLADFAPVPRQPLPFPSQVVASDNDPAATVARALEMARDWGAEAGILSGAGHINVKSGHHRWDQGFAYLYRLQSRAQRNGLRRA
ncbi:RBBP9/YdeN family alpha/beta hydrolase [Pseudomonas sp. DC3000-4b1]|uniref:RBBP9/YdeN family alpha/beta hydrolase n=1 Tax=unclassified Pseudomonas TaxID=196821 RepID=UPI003CFAD329